MKKIEEAFKNIDFFFDTKLIDILEKNSGDELDIILDSRDEEEFSSNWMKAHNDVKKILKDFPIDVSYSKEIETLRERTFKAVFAYTQSTDFAAYLSDDFGLLLDALICNYNNNWLNGLWTEYKKERIPHKNISLVEGKLEELI